MSFFRGIAFAGVAMAASVVTAQSADLYGSGARGSIKDDVVYAAPRGCPTWYARFDGGYTTYDRPSYNQAGIDDLVYSKLTDSGSIGGGIGRYFTCNIRGDITADHRFESDTKTFNPNPFAPNFGPMKWGYSSTSILANIYYDFNPGARITPYIGFGLGAANNEFSRGTGVVAAGGPVPGTATSVASSSNWSVAGAFMTGFVFNLTERMKFDTGYRFLYLGDAKTGQTTNAIGGIGGPIHADNLHAHEFRIGLRYDIR